MEKLASESIVRPYSRFRQQHPGIEIKLHTGDTALTLERVLTEQEDIGIAALPDNVPSSLCVQVLTTTPLVLAGIFS